MFCHFWLILPTVIYPSVVIKFSFAVKNVYIRRTLCPILLGHILVTVPKIEKRNFPPNDPSFHFFKRILRVCKLIIGVYGDKRNTFRRILLVNWNKKRPGSLGIRTVVAGKGDDKSFALRKINERIGVPISGWEAEIRRLKISYRKRQGLNKNHKSYFIIPYPTTLSNRLYRSV